jgi:DNA-directed RNA polymerase
MRPSTRPKASAGLLAGTILEQQVETETDATTRGVARYRRLAMDAVERGEAAGLKPCERMLIHWLEPLVYVIEDEIQLIRAGEQGIGRGLYGPIMLCLSPDRMAVIAIHQMLGRCLSEPSGDLIPRMAYAVGSSVIAEIHMDLLKANEKASLRDLDRKFKRLNTQRINWWAKKTLAQNLWNRKVCIQLGTKLMWCVIETASSRPYTEDFHLAFHHEKQWRDNQKKGVIRLDSEVFQSIEDGHLVREHLRPRYQPMICAPLKWSVDSEGGYIKVRTPLISKPTPEQEAALLNAPDGEKVYDHLNKINSQSWRINGLVVDVLDQLWDEGGGIAGIPGREDRPMPARPSDISTNADAKAVWKSEAHDVHTHNNKLRGQRIEFMHKIRVAKDMLDTGRFWLPHQICFRARAYPIPLYLHPQSDSVARSMLCLGTDEKLTERGWYWLKVQACNMYGLDKQPLDDRASWSDDNMKMINDVAHDPLQNLSWLDAADPPQFLAACMGLHYPDTVGAMLPVQVDGSMNGLQHLSAAGRCEKGGRAVNLIPSSQPEDVYLEVLAVVEHRLGRAADEGHPIATMLLPLLSRSLVKRPCMTRVYGLTKVGARLQVMDELKDLGVPKGQLFRSGQYLANEIMDSIGSLCGKATEIFEWLEMCGKLMVGHSPYRPLQWTSPIGMPVVQPYRNYGKCTIKTCLQRVTVAYRKDNIKVSPSRQVLGLPPNIVHSWDGSHMFLTGSRCHDENIAFGAVHDSYWSHANKMDRLGVMLREEFVSMHQANLLGSLWLEWTDAYHGLELPPPPEQGGLDIKGVLDSTYFFA